MDVHDIEVATKVKQAISFMRSVAAMHNVRIAFSGGKDSIILEFLAKEAGIKVDLFHNVTTIDPKGTIVFCERHKAQLIRSELSFLDLVEKKGFPTMFRRFCCQFLKKRYVCDYAFFGIRKCESVKRNLCYSEMDDIYYYTKKKFTNRFFPLLHFTDEDIEFIVNRHSLECHPLYYTQDGKFCVDRRLGCIGCPLQSDRGKHDFLTHPILLKQVIRRGILFHQRKGRAVDDAALNLVYNLFYSNHGIEYYRQTYQGLFYNDPWDILERYFHIDKDDVLRYLPKPKF